MIREINKYAVAALQLVLILAFDTQPADETLRRFLFLLASRVRRGRGERIEVALAGYFIGHSQMSDDVGREHAARIVPARLLDDPHAWVLIGMRFHFGDHFQRHVGDEHVIVDLFGHDDAWRSARIVRRE